MSTKARLKSLPPLLRLFEGCARGYIGRVEGANIIKLHRFEFKVSYLNYPAFEEDPHPALAQSTQVDLQSFRVKVRDFTAYANPPILHRKETFLVPDHPWHQKFARLTRLEEAKGLYEDSTSIGTRAGWEAALQSRGWLLKGHRLMRAR